MNRHPADRAKQFAPFDALKGFREALAQREQELVEPVELSEEKKAEIDFLLHQIQPGDILTIIYYHGQNYEKVTGMVSKLNKTTRTLFIVNHTIPFDSIYDIQTPDA